MMHRCSDLAFCCNMQISLHQTAGYVKFTQWSFYKYANFNKTYLHLFTIYTQSLLGSKLFHKVVLFKSTYHSYHTLNSTFVLTKRCLKNFYGSRSLLQEIFTNVPLRLGGIIMTNSRIPGINFVTTYNLALTKTQQIIALVNLLRLIYQERRNDLPTLHEYSGAHITR